MTSETDQVIQMLAAKRKELEERIVAVLSDSAKTGGGSSSQEQVVKGTGLVVDRLTDLAIDDSLRSEYQAVIDAEAKAAVGIFGVCDLCSDSIAPARVETFPWLITCVECAGF